jgi:nucleotide-binding universal stress UspA family protein
MTDPVVLAPLDGSKLSLSALPVARIFSELEEAPVRILHVTEQASRPSEIAELLGVPPASLRGATLESRAGDPNDAILQAAKESQARLVVLCTHTAEVRPLGAIGRTALAVLRGAPCPVVLVNPALKLHDWALRRLLVPHEGSPTVSGALRPAAELARKAGAELTVLQVADARSVQESGSIVPPAYVDQPQHEWPAWTEEFMQRLACICPLSDLPVRLLVAGGEPAKETLRVANEESTDLIVVAWKGQWAPKRAETFRAILRDAPCPMMVVRIIPAP